MLLHEGLTHIHSQNKAWVAFWREFRFNLLSTKQQTDKPAASWRWRIWNVQRAILDKDIRAECHFPSSDSDGEGQATRAKHLYLTTCESDTTIDCLSLELHLTPPATRAGNWKFKKQAAMKRPDHIEATRRNTFYMEGFKMKSYSLFNYFKLCV